MTYMDSALDQEMYNYFTRLDDAEKKSVILMLKTFLRGRNEGQELMSMEKYNQELDDAEAEFERGEYLSHEEALKQMKDWKNGK